MHELCVVFKIAESVSKIAAENGVERIHSVTVEIGEVSTVIPEYLLDVWKWNCRRGEAMLRDCELIIERIGAVTHCDGCGQDYETVPHGRTCPYCGSGETWLLRGNEFNIKEIAVE